MARPQKFRHSVEALNDPQIAEKLGRFVLDIEMLRAKRKQIDDQIASAYDAVDDGGFEKKFVRKVVSLRAREEGVRREEETSLEAYEIAVEKGVSLACARRELSGQSYAAQKGRSDARLVEMVAAGLQTETGRKALVAALDVMIEAEETIDPETGEIIETQELPETATKQRVNVLPQHEPVRAGAGYDGQATVHNAGVTAGETATNSPSDDDAFSEVKGAARPENAAGVEPSSSDNPSADAPAAAVAGNPQAPRPPTTAEDFTRPAIMAVSGDESSIPSSAVGGAKTDGAETAHPGRADDTSGHAYAEAEQVATNHQPKPHCLEPASCKLGFTTALCWKCNDARMKARAEV